jgi:hypothetical protein
MALSKSIFNIYYFEFDIAEFFHVYFRGTFKINSSIQLHLLTNGNMLTAGLIKMQILSFSFNP